MGFLTLISVSSDSEIFQNRANESFNKLSIIQIFKMVVAKNSKLYKSVEKRVLRLFFLANLAFFKMDNCPLSTRKMKN